MRLKLKYHHKLVQPLVIDLVSLFENCANIVVLWHVIKITTLISNNYSEPPRVIIVLSFWTYFMLWYYLC